jgi:DNA replication protein DnaC
MDNHTTIEKLKQMRMYAMAQVHYAGIHENMYQDYSTDEYLALMVDQEWQDRENRKITNLITKAGFKLSASPTDVDYNTPRGLDKNYFERLLSLEFVKKNQNILLIGATGVGKSYLAQAIGHHACTMLYKTLYYKTSQLMESLKLAKVNGTYLKTLKKLQKVPLLILDDFGLHPFDNTSREALMDLIEERDHKASTIIASQIPVANWHELIGESTIADAVLDRLVNASHRIELSGESLRKNHKN